MYMYLLKEINKALINKLHKRQIMIDKMDKFREYLKTILHVFHIVAYNIRNIIQGLYY